MTERIKIIYEDADLLVIDKPAGLVVHPDGRTNEVTLVDWLIENRPEIKNVGEPLVLNDGTIIDRPGIVHRIDRETSGVLVVTKTPDSFDWVKKQFQDHAVEKRYLAFLYGEMKEDDGTIDRPIGRSSKDFRLWSAQRGSRGKKREAVTHFSVLMRGLGFTYVEARPKTGRTHQLRVHFKAINHPIVADRLYAPNLSPALDFKRLALHASSVTLRSKDGQDHFFEAPLPQDFVVAKEILEGKA